MIKNPKMFIILSFIIFWQFKNLYHITLYHIMKSCKNLIIFVLSYFNMIKSHFDFFRKVPLFVVFYHSRSHYPYRLFHDKYPPFFSWIWALVSCSTISTPLFYNQIFDQFLSKVGGKFQILINFWLC